MRDSTDDIRVLEQIWATHQWAVCIQCVQHTSGQSVFNVSNTLAGNLLASAPDFAMVSCHKRRSEYMHHVSHMSYESALPAISWYCSSECEDFCWIWIAVPVHTCIHASSNARNTVSSWYGASQREVAFTASVCAVLALIDSPAILVIWLTSTIPHASALR